MTKQQLLDRKAQLLKFLNSHDPENNLHECAAEAVADELEWIDEKLEGFE